MVTAAMMKRWKLDNRLRTTSYSNLTSSGSGNTTYGYSLQYTPTSSVKSVSETTSQAGATPTSWSWTLLYDQLERLTNATSGGAISIACTETYDAWGNRIDQEPTPGMTGYSCSSRNTPVTAGTNFLASSSYDASGNTTFDGSNRYSYDAESRISSAAPTGQSATTYTYGADGALVSKNNGQTNFLRDLDGTLLDTFNGGSAQAQELWILGKHFGTVFPANNGTQVQNFSVTNWLGSEAARTDPATGLASSAYLSQPYGDQQLTMFGSDTNDIHFTGKERDAESGLDYFGARYFGSNMGRFMSPDSYGGRLADPQSLNKYAYARNNPLIYVDPDGHDFNLTGCGTTNTATCNNNMVGTTSTDGKNTFTATVISNGANGLQDQAGNAYSGTVTSAGVSFSQNGSNTSYGGSWINGSNDTSFSQTGGALNGFSFNFSQPNTATGQTLAGTFSYGDNMSASQAGKALEAAGFTHSYFDAVFNPFHGYDVTHYRGGGDPNTGAGAAHFVLDDPYKVDDGYVMGPVRAGEFHYGEQDPRKGLGGLYQHVTHDVIPSLSTPH